MSLDLSISVLVVDDYKTMIRIIKNLLKQIGFNDVDDASDGAEALEKLKQKQSGAEETSSECPLAFLASIVHQR